MKCFKHYREFDQGGCPDCKAEALQEERELHELDVEIEVEETAHLRSLPAPDDRAEPDK